MYIFFCTQATGLCRLVFIHYDCFSLCACLYNLTPDLVRELTLPIERPPLVSEVGTNLCRLRVSRVQNNESPRPYSRFSMPDMHGKWGTKPKHISSTSHEIKEVWVLDCLYQAVKTYVYAPSSCKPANTQNIRTPIGIPCSVAVGNFCLGC
jgi:hypothetical protein